MSWLDYFIRPRALPPSLAARVTAWQRLPAADPAMAPRRWVVVDTETSGLDTARCNLIAIGAVAIENDAIVVAPSFEAVLRQDSTSPRANIEIHGVGAEAQAQGEEPAEALIRFLEFVGKDALIAYHVAFDAAFLRRAIKAHLGLRFTGEWVDIAVLAPVTYPDFARSRRGLDGSLARFGIEPGARHNALADAYATAQLFQIVARRAARDGRRRLCDLQSVAGEHAANVWNANG
jgi:DNA polymerase-3 subunit epsilon